MALAFRHLLPVAVIAMCTPAAMLFFYGSPRTADAPECHGGRLGSPQARNAALENGYEIDRKHDCITRASWESVNNERSRHQQALKAGVPQQAHVEAPAALPTLEQARSGFVTGFKAAPSVSALPRPPAALFVRHDYTSAGLKLAAFVSPDPGDGQRHPAIVWLTGGDSNSLGDFWTPGFPANDQSASAYREAGIVMMFPTLRGGNDNPGQREFGYGEVDDVIAAAHALAQLPYVDPRQIYLGGHSTGGTLALLTAELPHPFRTVFAFGPANSYANYGPRLLPQPLTQQEERLRAPLHWLHGLHRPTYVIEGSDGNHDSLRALCGEPRNPQLHCLSVPGHDHFSVLAAANRRLAAQIFLADPTQPIRLAVEDLTADALAH